jgi:hypothetical protein
LDSLLVSLAVCSSKSISGLERGLVWHSSLHSLTVDSQSDVVLKNTSSIVHVQGCWGLVLTMTLPGNEYLPVSVQFQTFQSSWT